MRPIRLAATALTLLLFAQPGGAEPLISKTYSYFSIGGRTSEELERELARRGPMLAETGVRHAGATRIKLGGTVEYDDTGSRCRVSDAIVRLETRLTLPRWTNRKHANADTTLVWDTLSSDIKRHEERHAELARQYARKLEKALEGLRSRSDCKAMAVQVDAKTKSIVAQHAADQERFDRVEAASFERRMARLLRYRTQQRNKRK